MPFYVCKLWRVLSSYTTLRSSLATFNLLFSYGFNELSRREDLTWNFLQDIRLLYLPQSPFLKMTKFYFDFPSLF